MILHANNANQPVYVLCTITQFLTEREGNLRETFLLRKKMKVFNDLFENIDDLRK
jgi:hypothetical protein